MTIATLPAASNPPGAQARARVATQGATRVQWSKQGQDALDKSHGLVTCGDPASFRSRGVQFTFGDVIVCDTVQTACSIAPTHDDESGDADYVSTLFVLSGGFEMVDAYQQLSFAKGAAGWMPGWTRVGGQNLHTSRFVRISVPRRALAGSDRRQSPVGLFEGSLSLTTPALSFVLELMHATDDRTVATVGGHPAGLVLTQLVSALFLEQSGYRTDSADVSVGLWARAAAVIDREFADPMLDPGALAVRLHVSLRHLQRIFAQQGSTISDAIRERRVEAAVDTLTGGTSRYLSLSEVAAMSGFSSIKEMRFALRTRHGMTPRQFRSSTTAAALSLVIDD